VSGARNITKLGSLNLCFILCWCLPTNG